MYTQLYTLGGIPWWERYTLGGDTLVGEVYPGVYIPYYTWVYIPLVYISYYTTLGTPHCPHLLPATVPTSDTLPDDDTLGSGREKCLGVSSSEG